EIFDSNSVTIKLPDYLDKLGKDFTIQITAIYDDEIEKYSSTQGFNKQKVYNCSRIKDNKFKVYGPVGSFYWLVHGKRHSINTEPDKSSVDVRGSGPYKWIS
ncbi:hypothetical protein EBU71_23495, partial [bacterium]|nr:hypothetical protein [Candidatus Elulimicrobium humile]